MPPTKKVKSLGQPLVPLHCASVPSVSMTNLFPSANTPQCTSVDKGIIRTCTQLTWCATSTSLYPGNTFLGLRSLCNFPHSLLVSTSSKVYIDQFSTVMIQRTLDSRLECFITDRLLPFRDRPLDTRSRFVNLQQRINKLIQIKRVTNSTGW